MSRKRPMRLPGWREEDTGLGELLKEFTVAVGIRPCGGCQERARRLDELLTFSGRRRQRTSLLDDPDS